MLEAIKKFVLERGRDLRQSRRRVVEEDDLSPAQSEVLPQLAEESSEEQPSEALLEEQPSEPSFGEQPSDPPVRGRVKWFNPSKRYGFVELLDGSGDAFMHATVLRRMGVEDLQPGETLELRLAPGQRGPQVTEIISIDSSTAVPASGRASFAVSAAEASVEETGIVKWYSSVKGFGFIVRDQGGKDIFVHASVLQRAGLINLSEGQRVVVGVVEGRKGPEATSIQLT
jgi:cold shock protein